MSTITRTAPSVLVLLLAGGLGLHGQRGGPPQPPPSPRAAAPVDLTGYWVSLVTEDWRYRVTTPPRGDFAGVGGLMRLPGRIHITWQDDETLKLEADAGTQTRLLAFRAPRTQGGDWQGCRPPAGTVRPA